MHILDGRRLLWIKCISVTGSREWHYIQYITTHGIHDMIEIDYYTVRQHKKY